MNERSYEEMVQFVLERIIRAFGKGEDLRSAAGHIVSVVSEWGAQNEKVHNE